MRYVERREIKRKHHGHFFDRESRQFFDSRIARGGYQTADGAKIFFVTSEQFHDYVRNYHEPRRYSVRVLDVMTGDIRTWPSHDFFQAYETNAQATAAAKRAAQEG